VQNVVASMGTALPVEQLKLVAEIRNSVPGGKPNDCYCYYHYYHYLDMPNSRRLHSSSPSIGRIILCLDGDDAGKNAVERLCSSNILSNVPELSKNELYVATLSGGEVKDPSDFVNMAGGGEKARMRFLEEILDNAIPWDEWYIDRLLSKHEVGAKDGTAGSFAGICNELSTFLATFSNPADRTRRSHKIAEKLVTLIAEDEMSSSSISMLRVQLESDILNMSSRKAGVREAIERRIEMTDGVSGEATASKMKRLSSGDLDGTHDDERKMSVDALAMVEPQISDGTQRSIQALNPPRQRKDATRARSFRTNPKRRTRQHPERPTERHLVPHFNGFEFKHQSDRDWLGLSDNGVRSLNLVRVCCDIVLVRPHICINCIS
jgi:DNA primase